MRHRIPHLYLFLAVALTLLGQVSSAPTPPSFSTETLLRRQENGNPLTQTMVTQTVQTINTDAGPVTETCTITFTPITGSNGEPLVKVVRQCSLAPGAQSSSSSTASTASTTLSSASSSATTSTSSINPGVSVNGISSVPRPTPLSTTSTTTSSPTSPSITGAAGSSKSTTSSGGTSPVTVADNTSSSPSSSAESAFQIPGKKISVLPIGLGIFAGISVIALIVVGLVTYERTKYRKIFRQRKLAEQGAGMAYT
ncbi:hypothetical protein DFH94DRAFT_380725 [Russula ochroleuca]|uniref:Uncharacterized protein n=1 Tax=Russula ochroleuca TaxID=152965 RepID=A0A9P5TB66_9AGAM|nr:hypothetical protein DFH94DRAFT_380725 [Russula ochroleuca]